MVTSSHNQPPVIIVMGGQFGSEGKGEVVGRLVQDLGNLNPVVSLVRVGGPQAGHSVTFEDGRKISLCQIPCGFHVQNAGLFIGPGSEIDPDRLRSELEMLDREGWSVYNRLKIDPRATILEHEDKETEAQVGLTGRLGSTAKGIGACRSRRIMRTAPVVSDNKYGIVSRCFVSWNFGMGDIRSGVTIPYPCLPYPGAVVVETAQGYGLSLTMAGCYPFCTSTDITPGRAMSDAGISSREEHRVIMVVRTFPIRVHGNSGPMYKELSWEDLHVRSEGRSPAAGELTTVTKKTRRIGEFDFNLFRAACEACRPDGIVVTFMDYLDPKLADCTRFGDVFSSRAASDLLYAIEDTSGAPVIGVGTGPGKLALLGDVWPNGGPLS